MKDKIEKICYDLELGCIDWKDASSQLFDLFAVSYQREPLIAFHKWQQNMWTSPNDEITENVVDVYLKTNNYESKIF